MSLSRKNYVAIAEILADVRQGSGLEGLFESLATEFACYFEEDNPAFDTECFMKAARGET